jgi:hypothetical protein
MDLNRMLHQCRGGQWRTEDLDWSRPRPEMSREKEMAVVQYFTDMAGIERLAAALFEEQRARAEDPVLAEIFGTFVEDERRHARCAELLAAHYDVHRLKQYRQNEELIVFGHAFGMALRHLSAEIATVYVTVGELLLDVALLRSIDAYVDDPMSSQVMERINRDESRHIAMDFYMTEYYASPDYQAWLRRQPRPSVGELASACWAFSRMMRHARPFLRAIFLDPMDAVDPAGRRIAEAFSRYQQLIDRPTVRTSPLARVIHGTQWLAAQPRLSPLADRLARVIGLPRQLLHPRDEPTSSTSSGARDWSKQPVIA